MFVLFKIPTSHIISISLVSAVYLMISDSISRVS